MTDKFAFPKKSTDNFDYPSNVLMSKQALQSKRKTMDKIAARAVAKKKQQEDQDQE